MDDRLPGQVRILLIDDDEDDYQLTHALLMDTQRREGQSTYSLEWVATFEDAITRIRSGQFDVFLVDYYLGGKTGLSLLKTAQAWGCHAPFILITGFGSYDLDLEAMHAGATDYLSKRELTGPVLERSIRYALDRKRNEDALRRQQDELERRVYERTLELERANQELLAEIREREIAQEALKAERKRLYTLLEELPAFVSLLDQDYRIRFANCRFLESFGDPAEKSCYEVMRQRSEPCEECPIAQVLRSQLANEYEWTLPNGKSYQVFDYPFIDPDGTQLVLEVGMDITHRKEMENQLENRNRQLRALSKASLALSASLVLDDVLDLILEQIQVVVPCKAAAIMLIEGSQIKTVGHRGLENEPELVGLLSSPISLENPSPFRTMVETGEPVYVQDTWADPLWQTNHILEWVRSYAAAPLLTGGKVIGFLNVSNDQPADFEPDVLARLAAFAAPATVAIQNARLYRDLENALHQEQEMRDQLVLAEKFAAIGRMVASVAHELNNPLQTIKNCLFLIQQEVHSGGSQDYLDMAYSETQRLSYLVTQLRELYRPRPHQTFQPVDLLKLISEVHTLLLPKLKETNVEWSQMVNSRSYLVMGSADSLKQVFLNLSTNALEAMSSRGGQLSIALQPDSSGNLIGFSVKDTGPGIPPENLTKLFEPFFTTKPNGLGLGLSISYEIVERHGGRIEVSSPVGEGVTFTVWLPTIKMKDRRQRRRT